MASHAAYDFAQDQLWVQFSTLYKALKRRQVAAERFASRNGEARKRYEAVMALNNAIDKGLRLVGSAWPEWESERRQIAVDLTLKAFCKSRNDPSCDLQEVRWRQLEPKIWSSTPGPLGPANAVAALLKNAVDLFSAPIVVGELPFAKECEIITAAGNRLKALEQNVARRHDELALWALVNDRESRQELESQLKDDEQRVVGGTKQLAELKSRLEQRLERLNAEREVCLEALGALGALLAQFVPIEVGPGVDQSHASRYFPQLGPEQQEAAVDKMRDYFTAACQKRTGEGEPLDPGLCGDDLLRILGQPDLGLAWRNVSASLESLMAVVGLYKEREQAASVVRLAELSRPAERVEWVSLFSNLSQSWQKHAVRTCQRLREKVAGYLSEHNQLPRAEAMTEPVSELLTQLYQENNCLALLQHHNLVDPAPHSHPLSLGTSSHHHSTGTSTASPFFPGARSRRW